MKKAFTLVVLIVAPTMAFAQGTVVFANQTGLVKQWTSINDTTLIKVPVGGGSVELLVAPAGTPLSHPLFTGPWGAFYPNYGTLADFLAANPGWVALATTRIWPIAGIFTGGVVTIPNIAAGANADYFLIGWTGPYISYDAACAALHMVYPGPFLGMSAIATTATGDPTATPPGIPVFLRPTFLGMTLPTVPEPSSFALAGLGLAALLTSRRRA